MISYKETTRIEAVIFFLHALLNKLNALHVMNHSVKLNKVTFTHFFAH